MVGYWSCSCYFFFIFIDLGLYVELYPARRTSFCIPAGVRRRKWKLFLSLNRFKPLKLLGPEHLDLSILFLFDILFFSDTYIIGKPMVITVPVVLSAQLLGMGSKLLPEQHVAHAQLRSY